jgi:hypothetical protein
MEGLYAADIVFQVLFVVVDRNDVRITSLLYH